MIRAVFFDIDGTLLSHSTGTVPADTRRALEMLRQKGIKVFAATGRHILELEELPVKDIVFDGYVTLNGQICLDADRKMFFGTPVREGDIRRILPLFEGREVAMMFVERQQMYMNMVDRNVIEAQRDIETSVPEVGAYTGAPIYQVIVYGSEEELERVGALMENGRMVRWHERAVDFIPADSGKMRGIEQLLLHYGLAREEIAAFGDGNNDIDMIGLAGLGIAMGNACDELKRHADHVTDDVDRGGVVKALEHFGIL